MSSNETFQLFTVGQMRQFPEVTKIRRDKMREKCYTTTARLTYLEKRKQHNLMTALL